MSSSKLTSTNGEQTDWAKGLPSYLSRATAFFLLKAYNIVLTNKHKPINLLDFNFSPQPLLEKTEKYLPWQQSQHSETDSSVFQSLQGQAG